MIDREEPHRGTVLRRHVGDRCAVRHRKAGRAVAEELDELADHLFLAQKLGDGQHQIGGSDAAAQPALQVDADHVGREQVHGLPQHRGLGLDAADTPADHADAVDHRRVTVGADQRVRKVDAVALMHAARKELQVDLVHDAEAGRYHAERVERLHAPLHELVAFPVALEFEPHVQFQSAARPVVVDHHRMVDHQVDRNQRLDQPGLVPHPRRNATHRGQVDQQRHPGEILQHHARDHEWNLFGARGPRSPGGHLPSVILGDFVAVAVPEHRLQHHADRMGQAGYLSEPGRFQRGETVELSAGAAAGREFLQAAERVWPSHSCLLIPASSTDRPFPARGRGDGAYCCSRCATAWRSSSNSASVRSRQLRANSSIGRPGTIR